MEMEDPSEYDGGHRYAPSQGQHALGLLYFRTGRPRLARFAVVLNVSGLIYTQRRLMIMVLCVVKELHGPKKNEIK